jgi:hypothetical protein
VFYIKFPTFSFIVFDISIVLNYFHATSSQSIILQVFAAQNLLESIKYFVEPRIAIEQLYENKIPLMCALGDEGFIRVEYLIEKYLKEYKKEQKLMMCTNQK